MRAIRLDRRVSCPVEASRTGFATTNECHPVNVVAGGVSTVIVQSRWLLTQSGRGRHHRNPRATRSHPTSLLSTYADKVLALSRPRPLLLSSDDLLLLLHDPQAHRGLQFILLSSHDSLRLFARCRLDWALDHRSRMWSQRILEVRYCQ